MDDQGMKTQAILFTGCDQVELGDVTVPEPGPGEVLIRTEFSAVSPGTELRCLAGRQPGMGAWPVLPGYQATGRVVRAGSGVKLSAGTPVYFSGTQRLGGAGRLWGGHIAHAVVAVGDVLPLAPGASLADSSLNKLAAIAHHGVRLASPMRGETVLVIGLGPIGLLAARLHALAGARVFAMDVANDRVLRARESGLEAHVIQESAAATLARLAPGGADIVVDTTGAPAVLADAVTALRSVPWGEPAAERARPRLVVQGSYPENAMPAFPYYPVFEREAAVLTPRDCEVADLVATLALISSGRLKVHDLYGGARGASSAPEVYGALRTRASANPTAVFAW
jgi:3-hydroxyethyl bacteriochlorophyllide a dehydrogenase